MKIRFWKKKVVSVLAVTALCAMVLTGCGNSGTGTEVKNESMEVQTDANAETSNAINETDSTQVMALSGSLTMAGSTSMEKFCNALIEAFMELNPEVSINAEYIGSSAGIEALTSKSADIGNASRALKDSETQAGVVENIVAIDGIAVIVDKANTIGNLTKDQLTKIYTGETKNWKDLGGNDMPIVVVGREAGSGTRGAFEELLAIEDACAYANELDSTGAVMAKVASIPGAIGYVSLDVLDASVNAVSLDGSQPNADEIKAGNYFLSRPFVMATLGPVSEQTELVKALFTYLASSDGTNLIESVGLIIPD